jgi:hypothetical protein
MAKSKTFKEIWDALDVDRRRDVKSAVIAATRVSEVAFYTWANGERRPKMYPVILGVTNAVNSVLGTNYTYSQLFPLNS